jgi:hypothetical protein
MTDYIQVVLSYVLDDERSAPVAAALIVALWLTWLAWLS